MSSGERREQVLQAAVSEFAVHGLHGTSTEDIARRVGVSQPYLFRLFGTKMGLFLAAVHRCFDHTTEIFEQAAETTDVNKLHAMGHAYRQLVSDREQLLMQMQAYAACGDPQIRSAVRARFSELVDRIRAMSGADENDIINFFRTGMLLNVMTAMDLLTDNDPWARLCLEE